MKVLLLVFCVFSLTARADGHGANDPEAWYKTRYAPLWADQPSNNLDKMLTYYADIVTTYGDEGAVTRTPKAEWLVLDGWIAEGWLSATLQTLETERLNDSTAVFKASWLDTYTDAPDETSCGWYLAGLVEGQWQFFAYTDIDCETHGLI
ncbi:MAG: hypothetical protein AAGI11_10585 [Pseudomonadota bacterium]